MSIPSGAPSVTTALELNLALPPAARDQLNALVPDLETVPLARGLGLDYRDLVTVDEAVGASGPVVTVAVRSELVWDSGRLCAPQFERVWDSLQYAAILCARDVYTASFYSRRWLEAIAGPRGLAIPELFRVHIDESRDAPVAHSHGLGRLWLHELQLAAGASDEELDQGEEIVWHVALVAGTIGLPEEGASFAIGEDILASWHLDRDTGDSPPVARLASTPGRGDPLLDTELIDGWFLPTSFVERHARLARQSATAARLTSAGDAHFDSVVGHDGRVDDWRLTLSSGRSLGPWDAYMLDVVDELVTAATTPERVWFGLCEVASTRAGGALHDAAGGAAWFAARGRSREEFTQTTVRHFAGSELELLLIEDIDSTNLDAAVAGGSGNAEWDAFLRAARTDGVPQVGPFFVWEQAP